MHTCLICSQDLEKNRIRDRERYQQRKEDVKARANAFKKNNPEHVKAVDRAYYQKNSEEIKAYQKEYNEKNREKVYARNRKWRDAHAEEQKQWFRDHHQRNIERRRAEKRAYYAANKEVLAEKRKAYNKAKPHVKRVNERRRDARKRGAGGNYTVKEWLALCEQFDNKCVCCGKAGLMTADHIVPIAKGGDSNITNIQPLCAKCNSSKHTKIIDYRMRWKVKTLKIDLYAVQV